MYMHVNNNLYFPETSLFNKCSNVLIYVCWVLECFLLTELPRDKDFLGNQFNHLGIKTSWDNSTVLLFSSPNPWLSSTFWSNQSELFKSPQNGSNNSASSGNPEWGTRYLRDCLPGTSQNMHALLSLPPPGMPGLLHTYQPCTEPGRRTKQQWCRPGLSNCRRIPSTSSS